MKTVDIAGIVVYVGLVGALMSPVVILLWAMLRGLT